MSLGRKWYDRLCEVLDLFVLWYDMVCREGRFLVDISLMNVSRWT